jgi:hemerythrin-like domain-containing protein
MRARTVTGYLQTDHERLHAIAAEVNRLAGAGSLDAARARFADFVSGLKRHIDVEERLLFPTFEERTGMTGGPTAVMRVEHADIRECMARVTAALMGKDAPGARRALDDLASFLATHNLKEERVLYPTTDRVLETPEALEALVARMEAF